MNEENNETIIEGEEVIENEEGFEETVVEEAPATEDRGAIEENQDPAEETVVEEAPVEEEVVEEKDVPSFL